MGDDVTQCFAIDLKSDIPATGIGRVELWFYTELQGKFSNTTHVLNLHQHRHSHHVAKDHFLGSVAVNAASDGRWIQFDVTHDVRRWVRSNKHRQVVQLSCASCSTHAHAHGDGVASASRLVASSGTNAPSLFITYDEHAHNGARRQKRDVGACREGRVHCCSQSHRITFSEHVQSKVIISPSSFDTAYCKGLCHPVFAPSEF